MCGITGIVNPKTKKVSLSELRLINGTIKHRGPDDSGEKIIDNVGLANNRLAIIDLSPKGHMPMSNSKKNLWITYNGEIYNYKELRGCLTKKGYKFKSNSDTEVILYLYENYGEKCLQKLDGMFAFAIWDNIKKQLFLARDHFGIKPLHYFHKNGLFIFGSEIKAILKHPAVKRSLNQQSLSQYFSIGFGAVPSPQTIFKNIYKLPPASYGILKKNKLLVKTYWHLGNITPKKITFYEAKEQLLSLLKKSVASQLVSDVPLGAFLSGGIDSSLIVALMKKYHHSKVKTFTIGFNDPSFDESQFANQVANNLNTQHFQKKFKVKELINTLPQVIDKLDEPLADASILPTYLLSKFTRKHVTVALSGDGGDELFAGYPTYLAHKFSPLISFLPIEVRKKISPVFGQILNLLPKQNHAPNLSSQYKINRFLFGANKNLAKQYLNFMGPMRLDQKQLLFANSANIKTNSNDSALVFIKKILNKVSNFDKQKQLQFLDFKTYLSEDCLVKTDRASSFNSLEVRVPFLTKNIVEFAFSLTSSYHLSGLTLKRLLKAVSADLIPREIINRPKKGFGIPVHNWLRKELSPLLDKVLNKKHLAKQGLFNPDFVENLLLEHQHKQEDHRMILWNLLIFQLWYNKWLK